jgi:hypothetical protein
MINLAWITVGLLMVYFSLMNLWSNRVFKILMNQFLEQKMEKDLKANLEFNKDFIKKNRIEFFIFLVLGGWFFMKSKYNKLNK